jgi:hypothetical protein
MIERLGGLREEARAVIALACAQRVFCHFEKTLEDKAGVLREAIEKCWGALERTGLRGFLWEELIAEVNAAVPGSQEEPEAGPAIPAGEAVISAVQTCADPTSDNSYEALLAAYTAVEMAEFLRLYPANGPGGRDAPTYEEGVTRVRRSPELLSYLDFVTKCFERLEGGLAPSEFHSSLKE